MTTAQIVSFADPGSLASPDLNLDVELRRSVVPYFYSAENQADQLGGGVGYAQWRRKFVNQSINQNDKSFALPPDFWEMKTISLGATLTNSNNLDFERDQLDYIGEDTVLVARAENANTQEKPKAYYYGGTPGAMTLKLQAPSDNTYTCGFSYYSRIVFADDTSSVDLTLYIPEQFQWALVELLRRRLYSFRFNVGDQRTAFATEEAARILQAARTNQELSSQGKRARFCR